MPILPHGCSGNSVDRRGRRNTNRLHRPSTSLATRCFTSSQYARGRPPDSMAAMRRPISASHACWASASAGPSRLAKSSAANSARADSLRRRASASRADAAFVMSESYALVSPDQQAAPGGGQALHRIRELPRAACRLDEATGPSLPRLLSSSAPRAWGVAGAFGHLAAAPHWA